MLLAKRKTCLFHTLRGKMKFFDALAGGKYNNYVGRVAQLV